MTDMQVFSGTGGRAPAHHRPAPKPVVHHATLTAFRSGPKPINPKIPAKYRPKRKPAPRPKPSVKFPALGKLPAPRPGPMVPVTNQSAIQKALQAQKTAAAKPGPLPKPPTVIAPYVNPFGGIKGLVPERVDQGVDYAGRGPIRALGPGVITYSGLGNTGWGPPQGVAPGGYVGERLSTGPAKGQIVYVSEGIYPTVRAGQQVKAGQTIANMVAPIEAGFASGSGTASMASATGELGGPVSTAWGKAYSDLVHALGAPGGIVQAGGVGGGNVPDFAAGIKGKVMKPVMGHVSSPPAPTPSHMTAGPVVGTPIAGGGHGGDALPPIPGVSRHHIRAPGPRVNPGGLMSTGTTPISGPGGPRWPPPFKGFPGPKGKKKHRVDNDTTTTSTPITSQLVNFPGILGSGGAISNTGPNPSPSSGSSAGTLLLLGGAALVVVLLLMHGKKGKGKGGRGLPKAG